MIYLARRNPALTRAEFPKRWRKHAATVGGNAPEALTEIRGTAYCHVQPFRDVLPHSSDEYDGVAILRLNGLASIPWMLRESVTNEVAMADELRAFSTYVKDFTMFTADTVLQDGPETPAALLQFMRRQHSVGPSAFVDAWRAHGAAVMSGLAGGLRRYVQNDVIVPGPPGFGFDGIAEMWFDSLDDVKAAAGEIDRLAAESEPFIQNRSGVLLATEVVMRWDPQV
jgi:hypothetical protein